MIICYKCNDVCGPWILTKYGFLCEECYRKEISKNEKTN